MLTTETIMNDQAILLTHAPGAEIARLVADAAPDRVFLLTDETTERLCRPLVADCDALRAAGSIVIGATDAHKTLTTLADVWRQLGEGGASRHSLLVCLGGLHAFYIIGEGLRIGSRVVVFVGSGLRPFGLRALHGGVRTAGGGEE